MRLRLQKYPLRVVYKLGPQIFISNTFSRVALPLRRTQTDMPDFLIFQLHEEERFRREVEETSLEEATFVTDQRLEQIRQETSKDAALQTLMTSAGWKNDKLQRERNFMSSSLLVSIFPRELATVELPNLRGLFDRRAVGNAVHKEFFG